MPSQTITASSITQYTMAGCQGSICPSMLAAYDKKTVIANVTKEGKYKNRNIHTKCRVHVQNMVQVNDINLTNVVIIESK